MLDQPQVIINDKTHNPFIIFGGLFSRKLISNYLNNVPSGDSEFEKEFDSFQEYKKVITSTNLNEDFLRKQIAKYLLRGVSSRLPANSQGDIFYEKFVIEVKNDLLKYDLDKIEGSIENKKLKRKETAVEELFRYLEEHRIEFGALTTGRIFRIYNIKSQDQYIEFDLFDIISSGDLDHLKLFKRLMIDNEFRKTIFDETQRIRQIQARDNLLKQLNSFLTESEKINRNKGHDKIVFFFFLVTIRYLEDVGILPLLDSNYSEFSLKNSDNFNCTRLLKIFNAFIEGKWFQNKSQDKLFTVEQIENIKKLMIDESVIKKAKKIFSDNLDFDYSDILIDQLGAVYQDLVNKNSEGAYYTPFVIGKKISDYLKKLSDASKVKFEDDPNKVIVDIACGSGQLLRALIPSAYLFFKGTGDLLGKNSLRRNFVSRFVGVDKDPNSAFICNLSLSLFAAEEKSGLSFPRLVKCEDTLEAFCSSRKNFIEIPREDIFSIIANPPWESLEFNESNVYRRVTGATLPKKSTNSNESKQMLKDFQVWAQKNKTILTTEKNRIDLLKQLCGQVENEHSEYFSGKKNTALHFMFIIHKLLEKSQGSYVVVMPDRFFAGDTTPLRDKIYSEFDGYMPFQDCGSIFDGVDKGTRFGLIFGRKRNQGAGQNIYLQIPVIENDVPVDFVSCKIDKNDLIVRDGDSLRFLMPFFKNKGEVDLLSKFLLRREKLNSWRQGTINLGGKEISSDIKDYLVKNSSGKFKIVKSEGRKSSGTSELMGILSVSFGVSLSKLPKNQEANYYNTKVVSPNVKRNGVRKIICEITKNCLVEHDYNFNEELVENDLRVIRSLTYNSIVNFLAGSYHINATVLNLVGKVNVKTKSTDDFFVNEVLLLQHLGFSLDDSVNMLFEVLLLGFPEDFVKSAYQSISSKYPESVKNRTFVSFSFLNDIKKQSSLTSTFFQELNIQECLEISNVLLSEFKNDPHFGRTKFAKLLYLSEKMLNIQTGIDWKKESAGPYNKNDILTIEEYLREKNQVKVEKKSSGMYKYTYGNVLNFDSSKKKKNSSFYNLFKGVDTERMEIIATLFAAWNDLLIAGKRVSDELIVNEFQNNWTPSKQRFSKKQLLNEIQWMRDNKLIPKGEGKLLA